MGASQQQISDCPTAHCASPRWLPEIEYRDGVLHWHKAVRRAAVPATTQIDPWAGLSCTQVVVLDKLDYCATLSNLSSLKDKPNFRFVKGDIQCADLISFVLETEEIDTVMHFAAQTHVDNSFGNSLAFTMNNT